MIVFVVGPGRCGSSAVARILHEELDVTMGRSFRPADENNPHGYWEDLQLKEHNQRLLERKMATAEWVRGLKQITVERDEPWGLKDPRLCYLLGHYLDLFPKAKIVRCMRDVHAVAKSMCKAYGWHYADALIEAKLRNLCLDGLIEDALFLPMDKHRSESDLVNVVGGYVHAAGETVKGDTQMED